MRALVPTLCGPLLLGALAAHAAGCGRDAADCRLALTCPDYAADHPLSGDGGVPLDCSAPPAALAGGVDPRCGIFAAPSPTVAGDGSQAAPFGSLQAAVDAAAASGKPVYACGAEFAEAVRIASGVTVYGALDCEKGWVWDGTRRTRIAAPAAASGDAVGAHLGAGEGHTLLADVDVVAPDAAAPGASSIALLIEDTGAELLRATLTAGRGQDGRDGESLADDPGLDGLDGESGYGICGATSVNPGPAGPTRACSGYDTHGGAGGDGSAPTVSLAGAGGSGAPAYGYAPAAGKGGDGQSLTACSAGHDGADGLPGAPGIGGDGLAQLGVDGLHGLDGTAGLDGRPGQGGGGGGGARGKQAVVCAGLATLDRAGATGGSGGTGGCGGKGGGGGQAGGASIALASLSTQLVALVDVALVVGRGGQGGKGGAGQNGGNKGAGAPGGAGASGTGSGCHGGDGGQGGVGGPGGGGRGGDVLGMAYSHAPPEGLVKVTFTGPAPQPGTGGDPGAGGSPNGRGANGTSAESMLLGAF